jgi:hypothetical protein
VRSAAEDRSGHRPPRTATYAPQEEDTAGRSRPEAATGQGLPPSVFVRMIAIGQPSTDLSTAGRDHVPTGLLMSGTGAPRPPTHYRLGAQPLQRGTVDNAGPKGSFADGAAPVHQGTDCCPAGRIPQHNASGQASTARPNRRSLEHTWDRSQAGLCIARVHRGGSALLNLGRSVRRPVDI